MAHTKIMVHTEILTDKSHSFLSTAYFICNIVIYGANSLPCTAPASKLSLCSL